MSRGNVTNIIYERFEVFSSSNHPPHNLHSVCETFQLASEDNEWLFRMVDKSNVQSIALVRHGQQLALEIAKLVCVY
jgi:hypothetical protein